MSICCLPVGNRNLSKYPDHECAQHLPPESVSYNHTGKLFRAPYIKSVVISKLFYKVAALS
jgi:hypothetical protein